MMTDLFLLRHGQTNASLIGAPLGVNDWPVNDYGQIIWPNIKHELLKLNIERVLTSNLVRAKQHALDLALPCQILPELNEQNFGIWDGVPWSDIKNTRFFFDDPINCRPPNGESFRMCAERASSILTTHWDSKITTLILAHAGSLRAILAKLLNIPLDVILQFSWQNYGLSKLHIYQDKSVKLCYHNCILPF